MYLNYLLPVDERCKSPISDLDRVTAATLQLTAKSPSLHWDVMKRLDKRKKVLEFKNRFIVYLCIASTTIGLNAMADETKLVSKNLHIFTLTDTSADDDTFALVREEIRQIGIDPKKVFGFQIHEVNKARLIWTDWYQVHKGEVKLRIEAAVWKDNARFEVWQNTGWFFIRPEKTETARKLEQRLTENFYSKIRLKLKN
jgi:hypothetical protein